MYQNRTERRERATEYKKTETIFLALPTCAPPIGATSITIANRDAHRVSQCKTASSPHANAYILWLLPYPDRPERPQHNSCSRTSLGRFFSSRPPFTYNLGCFPRRRAKRNAGVLPPRHGQRELFARQKGVRNEIPCSQAGRLSAHLQPRAAARPRAKRRKSSSHNFPPCKCAHST